MKLFFIPLLSILFFPSCSFHKPEKKKACLSLQADPISLDPRVGGDRRSQVVLRELYEGLMRLGKNGTPEKALAKTISLSDDQTVYTFSLQEANWSNGDPVTAYDFEYAWKSALEPSFNSSFTYAFYVLKNGRHAKMNECSLNDVGVLALDKSTLQVTLDHPTPYFLELLANPLFSPLPKKTLCNHPSWPKVPNGTYVSNGPFLLKEHVLKSHLLLQKNPSYWNPDAPKLTSISFAIIEDPSTAYALFLKKELDWFGDPCSIIPLDILRNISVPLTKKPIGGVFWGVTCTEKPYLASPKIRRGIACAINRKELVSYLNCGETPAFSNLPPFMSQCKKFSFTDNDPTSAHILFEEGLHEIGITKKMFPPLTITHWNEPSTCAIAELLQQQIQKNLGIKILLERIDWATYMKRVPAGEIDIALAPWYSWVCDPMFNLNYLKFRKNGINGTCWENKQYIDDLDSADHTIDPQERNTYMATAEQIFCEQLPLIPLFYMVYRYAKSDDLHGEVVSPVGAFELKWLEKDS